ncbi:MAG TPA: matrixin family metalloprotease [Polyangiaceae bacterium]|nr:matrixin family metalloprotease [Polyangiaceae bacterium]
MLERTDAWLGQGGLRCLLRGALVLGTLGACACHGVGDPPGTPTPPERPGVSSSAATSPTQPSATAAPALEPERGPSPTPAAQSREEPAPARRRFTLVPLGAELPSEDSEAVRRALAAFYVFEVSAHGALPLPRDAYYSPRSRYRAEKLLTFLEERAPSDSFRILGLTAVDISTTKGGYEDWGILGLASLSGRTSVISSFRTRRGAKDDAEARVRLAKTAVHEIGHTLGLEHCPHYGCLMEDARGSVFTTDREYELCDDCRAELERSGYELVSKPVAPPWPRPQ